jgi:hypothetical protein
VEQEQKIMSIMITAKFKVHNPSRRKQKIMDTALEEYTRAYARLLDWCKQNIDTLETNGKFRDKYSEASIRKLMPKLSELNQGKMHSSMYESLKQDVAITIASYLALRQQDPNTGFPVCRDPDPESYPNALEEFASVFGDENEYNEKRDRLLKVSRGSVMPIYFAGADGIPRGRHYSLSCDPKKKRFYAVTYLMAKGADGEPVDVKGNLVRMGWSKNNKPTDETHILTAKSELNIVLPLEMGKWHVEKFLNPCLDGKANVRTAFLSKSDKKNNPEYFMHITFKYSPDQVETKTFLGVDRGLANLIAITVTNNKGNIIHQALHSGEELIAYQKYDFIQKKQLQKRGKDIKGKVNVSRRNEEVCHALANTIVDVAKKYKSQVVMEWLKGFKEHKKDFGMLKRTPLQRIEKIADYKLAMAGLPKIKTVPSAYTSQECPQCGHIERKNRVTQAGFCCVQCSYETHADLNGSHNIARRWIERRKKRTLTAA